MAGDWQQHQVWDGTYLYDDLLDWHEMNMVKKENERRVYEYQQQQRELNGSH